MPPITSVSESGSIPNPKPPQVEPSQKQVMEALTFFEKLIPALLALQAKGGENG